MSCTQYTINELKKKKETLTKARLELKQREEVIKERKKLEGKVELELYELEFNQESWKRRREEQRRHFEYEV